MRNVLMMLLVAGVLAACGDVVIGPVDHSCHTDPRRDQGSGCGGGRGGSGG